MSDQELRSYSAIIVPSSIVSDLLRYTEGVKLRPPATRFLARACAFQYILRGIICHARWLGSPTSELDGPYFSNPMYRSRRLE
jgi:protease I